MTEKGRLLKLRKKMTTKRPKFVRCGSWQYVRVKSAWKRPNGIDSRMRRKEKGVARTVNVGYRGPKKVRGLHPTGLEEVIAHNLKDLEGLHRKKHIIKIARTVGVAKASKIIEKADHLGLLVANPGKIKMMQEELIITPEMREIEEELGDDTT